MSEDHFLTYRFETTAFPGATFLIRHVRLHEALDETYTLTIGIDVGDLDTDYTTFLGQDCVFEIDRGESRIKRQCGLIERISHDAPHVELTIVPALQLLSQRRDSRIFQEKTVPEILEEVLGKALGTHGREVTLDLRGTYPKREYCLQYQETDLDFAQRLMGEEGIFYGFDHEGDVEVLVLRDRNESCEDVTSGKQITYEPKNIGSEIHGVEPIHDFRRRHRPMVTSVAIRDWDWTRGGDMTVEAEERGEGTDGRDRESYEHGEGRSLSIWSYDQGVGRYQSEDSETQKVSRLEAHNQDTIVGEGTGRVLAMAPGTLFELTDHPAVGVDGEYMLTRVQHVGASLAAGADPYHNTFECIPVGTPHRPRRRLPKPRIEGIQTAVVTGPAGEEIHVDKHGRIKVQFHWDRLGGNDEHSSCWIRVQQPWAGAGWGFWWAPRIGMEVVVHFVDGDPDRPLITGCVYDGANPLPYPLPDEKTKSTMKSNTSLGGGGFNEFRFEDKAGDEEIFTHAQKDYNEVVLNDHNTLVHNDQSNTVDNDQTQLVKNDQTETVHANQVMTVDGNRSVHVKANYDETVDGTETRTVTGDVTENFDSNETRTVSSDLTESVGANETRTIASNHDETVTGNVTQTITGDSTRTITGSLTETVVGGITTTTPASYSITAVGGFNVTAVAGIKIMAPAGLTMVAPGGVTQVDSFYDWAGIKNTEIGVLAIGATGLKMEATNIAMAAVGMKVSGNNLVLDGTLMETVQTVAAIKATTTRAKSGAVGLYMMATVLLM